MKQKVLMDSAHARDEGEMGTQSYESLPYKFLHDKQIVYGIKIQPKENEYSNNPPINPGSSTI